MLFLRCEMDEKFLLIYTLLKLRYEQLCCVVVLWLFFCTSNTGLTLHGLLLCLHPDLFKGKPFCLSMELTGVTGK